ncbi:MAG: molybdenum cofactor guanylyltransferase [Desulfurivibrionaceae bacterium]
MRSDDFTGTLLAGGRSSRFGSNKALTRLADGFLIEYPAAVLADLFPHRLLITNTPEDYDFLGWPSAGDIHADAGPLAGIHAALITAATPFLFVAGCDMPFLDRRLIAHLCELAEGYDAVVPRTAKGLEPLHAVYRRDIVEVVDHHLARGDRKIQKILAELKVRELNETEILRAAGDLNSFRNINTVADLPE